MITLVTLVSTISPSALKWTPVETATDVPPAVFPFTAHPGLKLMPDQSSFSSCTFFGNDTMELLVEKTSRSVN